MTEGYEGQRADPDKDAGAQFAVLVRLQTIRQDDDVDTDCVNQGGLAVAQSECLERQSRPLTAAGDKHEEAVQVPQFNVAVEPVVEHAEEMHRAGKQDSCDALQSLSQPLLLGEALFSDQNRGEKTHQSGRPAAPLSRLVPNAPNRNGTPPRGRSRRRRRQRDRQRRPCRRA